MKEIKDIQTLRDGFKLKLFKWLPEEEIKAVLLLVHGSVEHAARYKRFANYLSSQGIAVIAHDMRGHGETTKLNGQIAYLEENGWLKIKEDLRELKELVCNEYPQKPLFIFGHSMGSILVRDFIGSYGRGLCGAICMGTTYGQPGLAKFSLLLVDLVLMFKKSETISPKLNNTIYGKFNSEMENPKTEVDFLSRDEAEVQKYINDVYCGSTVTINYAQQLAKGSLLASKPQTFSQTPKDLPILLVSGSKDPVGGKNMVGVKKVLQAFKKVGKNNVEMKIYEGARHELLNETNRKEISRYLLAWILNKLKNEK